MDSNTLTETSTFILTQAQPPMGAMTAMSIACAQVIHRDSRKKFCAREVLRVARTHPGVGFSEGWGCVVCERLVKGSTNYADNPNYRRRLLKVIDKVDNGGCSKACTERRVCRSTFVI